MELKTENEKTLFNMLVSICGELGEDKKQLSKKEPWDLLDLAVKDIHIRRITNERDKKKVKKQARDLSILQQKTFPFYANMKHYN